MVEASSRQYPLRQLFWLTGLVALTLGVWLPDAGELAQRHEVAAILLVLTRMAMGWIAVLSVARYVRLMPPFLRRLPLEFQVLAGLLILLIILIAASILLPPIES
jgi:hypothetical protein